MAKGPEPAAPTAAASAKPRSGGCALHHLNLDDRFPIATAPRQITRQKGYRVPNKKKRLVVKIGSSLLANTELLTPRFGFLQRLLSDIATLRNDGYDVIICSSGSVALGLNIVGLSLIHI